MFESFDTSIINHSLPFDLKINDIDFDQSNTLKKEIHINPLNPIVQEFLNKLNFSQSNNLIQGGYNSGSDQINISLTGDNQKISQDYISNLILSLIKTVLLKGNMSIKILLNLLVKEKLFLKNN